MSDRLLERYLGNINTINKPIQFTIETEKNKQLPFLDMLISRGENGFEIDVYRKPTFCQWFIPEDSNHPRQQKLGFLYSSIYQIFNFGLNDEATKRELAFLKDCCVKNGIDSSEVDRIFAKIKYKIDARKFTSLQSEKPEKPYFLGLTYNKFTLRLSRVLKKIECGNRF